MEDHQQVISWAIENRHLLKLKVTELTWTSLIMPGFFDFSVDICIDEINFVGRGTDRNKDLAFTKAITECCERIYAFYSNFKTSNGVAAHTSLALAKQNALKELVERDAFICQFYAGKPFGVLDRHTLLPSDLSFAVEKLKQLKINISLVSVDTDFDFYVTACIGSGRNFREPFGIVVGLGCEKDLVKSSHKSFLEMIRFMAFHIMGGRLNSDSGDRVSMHRLNALNLDYGKWFEEFAICGQNNQIRKLKKSPPTIKILTKIPSIDIIKKSPLLFCNATSEKMQNCFFGQPTYANLNLDRIRHLFSCNPEKSRMNILHPLS